ncbi:DUF4102 domain-containing protein [Pantoea dispersa]|nr:DUF4102 domain-containing protein [Pantoea dispersa]
MRAYVSVLLWFNSRNFYSKNSYQAVISISFFSVSLEGKPIQLTIGDYPSISLSQAREGRQQYRLLITEGLDPRQLVAPDRIKN